MAEDCSMLIIIKEKNNYLRIHGNRYLTTPTCFMSSYMLEGKQAYGLKCGEIFLAADVKPKY